jgi:hypothetical protein
MYFSTMPAKKAAAIEAKIRASRRLAPPAGTDEPDALESVVAGVDAEATAAASTVEVSPERLT